MATTASPPLVTQSGALPSVKFLAETPGLTFIPSFYTFDQKDLAVSDYYVAEEAQSIPVIDFALLTSGTPEQRSKVVQEIDRACEEWGFFMVVNHGIPESVMNEVIQSVKDFFDMTEEEKEAFKGKHPMDTICYGTSGGVAGEEELFWRDFLKVYLNSDFSFPSKSPETSQTVLSYCQKIREVVKELLKAVSESLGLEPDYIFNTMNMDSGLQRFVANLYPPCPQPELTLGMPPHSDHGLLTPVIQNGVTGLQVQHKGSFVYVNAIPNCIMFNTGDHLEILSNGKYTSNVHRALPNQKATRISIAVSNGPALDKVVVPIPEVVKNGNRKAAYRGIPYGDYVEVRQGKKLDSKSALDRVRIVGN